jgi:hypothetical protein
MIRMLAMTAAIDWVVQDHHGGPAEAAGGRGRDAHHPTA